jgi:AcrR family transcriptional regulator
MQLTELGFKSSARSSAPAVGGGYQGASVGRTPKGDASRVAFLEAARRVMARVGYLNAWVNDIAAEANRSPALFYFYFESKEALLAELAADFNTDLQRRVAEAYGQETDPLLALRRAIAAFWRLYAERLPEIVGIMQAAMVVPTFAAQWQEIHRQGTQVVARGIRQSQREGWAPGLDPELAASALTSMIEQFCFVWQYPGAGFTTRSLGEDEAVETLWQLWSHALYWRVPSGVEGIDLFAAAATSASGGVGAGQRSRVDGQGSRDTESVKKGSMR